MALRDKKIKEQAEILEALDNVKMFKFEDIIDGNIMNLYKYNIKKLSEANYFFNPEGIHGNPHAKRVLMLALIFSKLYELDTRDRDILVNTSLYHDIGRSNDSIDFDHGIYSFEKLQELDLLEGNDEDIEILRYVITEHPRTDEVGFNNINNYKIKNKDRAIKLLKIFKDCDGLDRLRIYDLDIRYLRTKYAIQLIEIAKYLLANVE